MKRETKLVKVYLEDWKTLNQMLGVLQAKKGERLSFADVVSLLLKGEFDFELFESMEKIGES